MDAVNDQSRDEALRPCRRFFPVIHLRLVLTRNFDVRMSSMLIHAEVHVHLARGRKRRPNRDSKELSLRSVSKPRTSMSDGCTSAQAKQESFIAADLENSA